MAGYYDPYTEEWIETEDQATVDFYDDYGGVDYTYDPNNYGYDYYDAASDPNNYGYDYYDAASDDYSWMYEGDDDFATGSIYNDDGTLNSGASAVLVTLTHLFGIRLVT